MTKEYISYLVIKVTASKCQEIIARFESIDWAFSTACPCDTTTSARQEGVIPFLRRGRDGTHFVDPSTALHPDIRVHKARSSGVSRTRPRPDARGEAIPWIFKILFKTRAARKTAIDRFHKLYYNYSDSINIFRGPTIENEQHGHPKKHHHAD